MSNQNKGIHRPGLLILFCILSVALNWGLLYLIGRYNYPQLTSIRNNNNDTIAAYDPEIVIIDTTDVVEVEDTVPHYTPTVSQMIDRHRTLRGYFEKDGTQYPVVLQFHQYGNEIRSCVYKNVNYGVKLKMSGYVNDDNFTFEAIDHHKEFTIDISADYDNGGWSGYARSGEKILDAYFEED